MESTWFVLLSLALGLFVGAGFVVLLMTAEERGRNAASVVNPRVPDGIDQMLDVLESVGIVLDPSNNVVKASPGAAASGLISNATLANPALVDLVARVRRSGNTLSEDLELARGPFGEASVRFHVRAARLGTRYVLLLADDRTDAHRLDEVRRDFIANISHELKTPIAAVSLLAEALDSAADDAARVRRFANRLTNESARLTRITRDIIELSRLQANDALRKPQLLGIQNIIAQAVDQNRVVAEAHGIQIAVRTKVDAQLWGDEALLLTSMHNLIANAVHYSDEGSRVGVGVRVSAGVIEISVTDQGVGIAEDELDRVFERFYRVDEARSRHTGGSGLGLSIVKHAVQNHGGDIRVWSQSGSGSTFTVRLPAADALEENIHVQEEETKE